MMVAGPLQVVNVSLVISCCATQCLEVFVSTVTQCLAVICLLSVPSEEYRNWDSRIVRTFFYVTLSLTAYASLEGLVEYVSS